MGRKPLGDTAMTPLERQHRSRAKRKAQRAKDGRPRDIRQIEEHVLRLLKMLKIAGRKYPLGQHLPVKMEMMGAANALYHFAYALLTGDYSPERLDQFDDSHKQMSGAPWRSAKDYRRRQRELSRQRELINAAASRSRPSQAVPSATGAQDDARKTARTALVAALRLRITPPATPP